MAQDELQTAAAPAAGAPPGEPLIRFEGVKKAFGKKVVLDGLDLDIQAGRCLVIMGPSGTGKSVTLRHIVGLIKPDAGRVLVAGYDMGTIRKPELALLRRRMGYLFQDGALINWLSVGENIALPLREKTRLSEAEIRERVQHKLELVHLPDTWDKFPGELSGGMRKRVGLARALITDPEIILYDEPNAGLDPEISASINRLIRGLQESLPITSIVISHEVACVRTVADRVVLLEAGRIVVDAPTHDFLHSDHPRLRRFLGEHVD
jgi:phospholipid/cholesterol/gamma-HCH transport system ATP-binding protein